MHTEMVKILVHIPKPIKAKLSALRPKAPHSLASSAACSGENLSSEATRNIHNQHKGVHRMGTPGTLQNIRGAVEGPSIISLRTAQEVASRPAGLYALEADHAKVWRESMCRHVARARPGLERPTARATERSRGTWMERNSALGVL